MTKEELIELMKTRPVDVEAFAERCRQREKIFREWEDSQKITKEFLDREYTI
jgi:hypothetical protein